MPAPPAPPVAVRVPSGSRCPPLVYCGRVQVSPGMDIGGAKLWTRQGLSLQVGESSVTVPRFRVSARALRLDALNLTTREAAKAALSVLVADHRWVTRLQKK